MGSRHQPLAGFKGSSWFFEGGQRRRVVTAIPGLKKLESGLVKSARLSDRCTIGRGSRPLKVADAKAQDSLLAKSGWVAGSVMSLCLLESEWTLSQAPAELQRPERSLQ